MGTKRPQMGRFLLSRGCAADALAIKGDGLICCSHQGGPDPIG